MIRILVVQDEAENHASLLRSIAQESGAEVVAVCEGVEIAREQVELLRPDAVFVSTEIPRFTGLEDLFAGIGGKRPHLIVMSRSSLYAVEAFSVNTIDYLLTPISLQRLKISLLRLRRVMEADQRLERRMDLETLVDYLRGHVAQARPQEEERVPINFGGRFRFVKAKGIRYVTADRDYVDIHMITGEVLHSTNRLSELVGKLSADRFLRIRRSVIVNTEYVREARAHKENYEIVMDDGTSFRPGTTYKTTVRAALVKSMGVNGNHPASTNPLGLRINP